VSEILISTILPGQAYSGNESVEPKLEIVTFKNNFGGVIPNTVFCPACSTLTEYNAKWGEIQEKKNPTERDYCFDVGYTTDGLEKYAKCIKCDFDLRTEAPTLEIPVIKPTVSRKQVKISSKITAETELIWISHVKYQGGFFTMPREEFMRVAKLGGVNQKLAARVGGSNYTLEWNELLSEYKEIGDGDTSLIGIARNHWNNL
jgi:hypothetical protein